MKRRSQNSKSWKPRLSAGGANRTNLQGVMARYQQEHDSLLIHPPPSQRPSASDLLPVRRINSFQPFQSRLQYPTRSYREWEPPPSRYSRSERSPERAARLVPRKGLFQNAKYSELPPPPEIDEERVRHTEEAIRRIIQKSHQSERFSLNADPNYHLRDSIIRQVYEQGVPEHYQETYRPSCSTRRGSFQPAHSSRHPYSHQKPRPSKHHYRGDRVLYEEEEYDSDEDDEEEVFRREEPPRKRTKKQRKEYEEVEEDEEEPEPRKRPQKRHRQKPIQEESSSEEEANTSKHSRTSRTSRASKKPKSPEKTQSPSPPGATGPYIPDTIDHGFEWKKSIPFMCDERGAALIDRIEAGLKRLPMRDDSQNCYSHVAHMLLTRSMKNMQTSSPAEQRPLGQPQSHLANMTTSWEHILHAAQEQEDAGRTSTSLFHDISRLQNPANASTIDTSIFANPWTKKKDRMPPPLHRSSPISNDIFNPEILTAPSSIKKLSGRFCVSTFEPPPKDRNHSDIDETEEITGSNFPANPDISFYDPDPVLSFDPLEVDIEDSSKSDAHKTMHINSRYEFTIREKRGKVRPMVDRDELEDEEMNREFSRISRSSQQERYLF